METESLAQATTSSQRSSKSAQMLRSSTRRSSPPSSTSSSSPHSSKPLRTTMVSLKDSLQLFSPRTSKITSSGSAHSVAIVVSSTATLARQALKSEAPSVAKRRPVVVVNLAAMPGSSTADALPARSTTQTTSPLPKESSSSCEDGLHMPTILRDLLSRLNQEDTTSNNLEQPLLVFY